MRPLHRRCPPSIVAPRQRAALCCPIDSPSYEMNEYVKHFSNNRGLFKECAARTCIPFELKVAVKFSKLFMEDQMLEKGVGKVEVHDHRIADAAGLGLAGPANEEGRAE